MTNEERFIEFFTNLQPGTLNKIETVFAHDARFKDPFNDVIGVENITTVFSHMFRTTENPRFSIKHHASKNKISFIHWDFTFTKSNKKWHIDGCSMVTFNDNGEVQEHIDYWDPAEQIYSKIGLLRPFMNFFAKQLKANQINNQQF